MTERDIHAMLTEAPIADSVVRVRKSVAGDVAVAYVVPRESADLGRLRRWISRKAMTSDLPVVPAFVDVIPRDPTGDVLEDALATVPVVEEASVGRQRKLLEGFAAHADVRLERAALPPDPQNVNSNGQTEPEEPADTTAPTSLDHRPAAHTAGPRLILPSDAPTDLPSALVLAAQLAPDHGVHVHESTGSDVFVTYVQLLETASRVASGLAEAGVDASKPLILQFQNLADYFPVLWGCLLAGIRPVTVAPPPGYGRRSAPLDKLHEAWLSLGQPVMLSAGDATEGIRQTGSLYRTSTPRVLDARQIASGPALHAPSPAVDSVAFMQLSAGSTGKPKAIEISHRGVLSYAYGCAQVTGLTAQDTTLNWLPLDHVGGLIMFHLRDVILRATNVHVATDWILAEPTRWLDLLAHHQVAHTWSPNFGYRMLAEALCDAPGRRWDLSRLRTMLNGGEQCTIPVVEQFLNAAAPTGIAARQLLLAWGMAETCTAITYKPFDEPGVVRRARDTPQATARPTDLLSVGHPAPGSEMQVVNDADEVMQEGVVGRLRVRSDRITPGYFGEADQPLTDGWFETGDLAFIADGEVVIAGRAKEVIVINGANILCHDVEEAVARVVGVLAGAVAACAVPDPESGSESIAIFFVRDDAVSTDDVRRIERDIRDAVAQQVGSPPALITAVSAEEFPRTTSGKIQRTALRDRAAASVSRDDSFPPVGRAATRSREGTAELLAEQWVPGTPQTRARSEGIVVLHGKAGSRLAAALVQCGVAAAAVELPASEADLSELIRGAVATANAETVIYVGGYVTSRQSNGPPDPELVQACADEYIRTAAALARSDFEGELVSVSRRMYTHDGQRAGRAESAILPALAMSVCQEWPPISAWHIDLPGRPPQQEARALASILHTSIANADTEVWDDGTSLLTKRLARVAHADPAEGTLRPRGLYVATGGLGGVGGVILEALLKDHDICLLVVGRTNLKAATPQALERQAVLDRLQSLQGRVDYVELDVADGRSLREAIGQAEQRWQTSLAGGFHFAGVYESTELADLTPTRWAHQTSSKIDGLINLADVLRAQEGSSLFVASSLLSSVGTVGSGAYAAANKFAETYCAALSASSSLRAHCVSWGLWRDLGINRDNPLTTHLTGRGIYELDAAAGCRLAALAIVQSPGNYLAGLKLDTASAKRRLLGVVPSPVEGLVVELAEPLESDFEVVADRWNRTLPLRVQQPSMPDVRPADDGRHARIEAVVLKTMADLLGRKINRDQPFHEAGLGSIELIRAQSKLEAELEIKLDGTALFEFPTAASLAVHLVEEPPDAQQRRMSSASLAPQDSAHLAIIGVGLRFPGAFTPSEYWQKLRDGVNCTTRFSTSELIASGHTKGEIENPEFVPVSGALVDSDRFDGATFGMSPREVALTSPQHRLLLEVVHDLLQETGYTRSDERESMGMFAGTGMNLYALHSYLLKTVLTNMDVSDPITALQVAIGNEPDFAATRIAYKLGLTGPAINVQTACSTSLVALHLACQAIRAEDCESAIVGAAAIHEPQATGYIAREGSILSPTGVCRAFDRSADGTVGGSGVAAVMIKRLAAARHDGDNIRAVVRGSSVNNDGSGKVGFTAPGLQGQTAVVRRALANARLEAEAIDYVQAHGTGTPIGDPLELQALSRAFGTAPAQSCDLTSVKSNVGHLDSAAGLAGLIATILVLQNREVPPQANFSDPNPDLGLESSPFRIPREPVPARSRGERMRGSVSALGVGGTNAHVVLESSND